MFCQKKFYRQFITHQSHTDNYTRRFRGNIGMMAERFAGMNIGNMDFNNGDFYAPNRVTNRQTGMRQSTRVEDNARVRFVELPGRPGLEDRARLRG